VENVAKMTFFPDATLDVVEIQDLSLSAALRRGFSLVGVSGEARE
jgi:hypothetical protein